MNIRIDLNEPQILQKVTSDSFGLFVSKSWKDILDPYTPKETGLTMQSTDIRPWEIEYFQPWSAYIYYGELYVDPKYDVGAFFDPAYGYWSRPGIKKIPSGRSLQYQKNNPYSTDHWDVKAAEAGQLDKLYRILNNGSQSGRF